MIWQLNGFNLIRAKQNLPDEVPGADEVGDHKVISEGCESRSNQSSIRSRGTRSCYPMDSIFSVQDEDFTWDGEKFVKFLEPVAQTKSCIYRQLDGIWQSLWRSFLEPLYINATQITNKWDCWENQVWMKIGEQIPWNVTPICETSQDLLFDGKTHYERRFGEPFKGRMIPFGALVEWKTLWRTSQKANDTFWSKCWISSEFTESPKQEFINLARKSYLGSFLAMSQSRGEFGKKIFWWQIWKSWKSWKHQIFYPRRINAKEVLIRQKDDELIFPFADGTVKLPGREYEFWEPTLRRDRPQRASSHWTSSSSLPAEHWNTLLSLGLLTQIWMCTRETDSQSSLCWKENLVKDICGPERDWQKFKRLRDKIMYGQKFGWKLVKPLRIGKTRNGQKKKKQSSTMLEDWEEFTYRSGWRRTQRDSQKNARRNLEIPMATAMPCKRQLNSEAGNWFREEFQNSVWLQSGISWIQKATRGIFSAPKIMKTTLQAKCLFRCRITTGYTSSSQCHKRCKFRMQKQRLDKEWKKSLRRSQHGNLEKVKSKKEVILEAQRDNKGVYFATMMNICHLKIAELEPKF